LLLQCTAAFDTACVVAIVRNNKAELNTFLVLLA